MNEASIVRTNATPEGVKLRLWVDDPDGRHVCVAEIFLEDERLVRWHRYILTEQNRAEQQTLTYE